MVEIKELGAFCKRVANTHTIDDESGEVVKVYVRALQGRRKGANSGVVMHVPIEDQTAESLENEITERLRGLEYTRGDRIFLEVLAKGTSRPILDRVDSRPYVPDVDDEDDDGDTKKALARTESAAVAALAGALVRTHKITVDRMDEQDQRSDRLIKDLIDTRVELVQTQIELRAIKQGQSDAQWDRALDVAERQFPAAVSAIAMGIALKGSGDAAKVAADPKAALEDRAAAALDVLVAVAAGGESAAVLLTDRVGGKLGALLMAMSPDMRTMVSNACAGLNAAGAAGEATP